MEELFNRMYIVQERLDVLRKGNTPTDVLGMVQDTMDSTLVLMKNNAMEIKKGPQGLCDCPYDLLSVDAFKKNVNNAENLLNELEKAESTFTKSVQSMSSLKGKNRRNCIQ